MDVVWKDLRFCSCAPLRGNWKSHNVFSARVLKKTSVLHFCAITNSYCCKKPVWNWNISWILLDTVFTTEVTVKNSCLTSCINLFSREEARSQVTSVLSAYKRRQSTYYNINVTLRTTWISLCDRLVRQNIKLISTTTVILFHCEQTKSREVFHSCFNRWPW